MARVLVVDNYDSFVFNLVQYLGQLGADTTVLRNTESGVATYAYDGVPSSAIAACRAAVAYGVGG